MKTDQEVRRLWKFMNKYGNLEAAAARAGMDPKTARKYRKGGKLPSEMRGERTWRTRTDDFTEVWDEVRQLLKINSGLEAKTILQRLREQHPGEFNRGQLRTLQRRIKTWRATEGPAREVFFTQVYRPGEWCASDFTCMNELGVTISGQPFEHMLYHFVLPYSNWETGTICFSESFESLSAGMQNALWELGGVPDRHRTDRLSAAVNNLKDPVEWTRRYEALLRHYGLGGQRTNPYSGHENGDVEQRHHRLKRAVVQAMMLRGSCDFTSRPEYEAFLRKVMNELNHERDARFAEERRALSPLPQRRVDAFTELDARVRSSSTIVVRTNVYSLHSRLIGEKVCVRVHADTVEVRYGGSVVETLERLRGDRKHRIDYRHVIDTLVRKPGAFAGYQYREDLFPTAHFRIAYDTLKEHVPLRADREYVRILHLAARESEADTDAALELLLAAGTIPFYAEVLALVAKTSRNEEPIEVKVAPVDLAIYDALLEVA